MFVTAVNCLFMDIKKPTNWPRTVIIYHKRLAVERGGFSMYMGLYGLSSEQIRLYGLPRFLLVHRLQWPAKLLQILLECIADNAVTAVWVGAVLELWLFFFVLYNLHHLDVTVVVTTCLQAYLAHVGKFRGFGPLATAKNWPPHWRSCMPPLLLHTIDPHRSSDLRGLFCTFAMRLWAGADYGKKYNIKDKCNNALQNYTNSATLQSWNRDKMHESYAWPIPKHG